MYRCWYIYGYQGHVIWLSVFCTLYIIVKYKKKITIRIYVITGQMMKGPVYVQCTVKLKRDKISGQIFRFSCIIKWIAWFWFLFSCWFVQQCLNCHRNIYVHMTRWVIILIHVSVYYCNCKKNFPSFWTWEIEVEEIPFLISGCIQQVCEPQGCDEFWGGRNSV